MTQIGEYIANETEHAIVKQALHKRLAELDWANRDNKAKMISLLTTWNFISGSTTPNNSAEQVVMSKFLIANFGMLTLQEMEQASQWAVSGDLSPDGLPVENYGRFSPQYISKVLNLYLNKREQVERQLTMRYLNEKWEKERREKEAVIPYADRVRLHRDFLTSHFIRMVNSSTSDVTDTAGNLVWKFLIRAKAFDKNDIYRQDLEELAAARMATEQKWNKRKIQFSYMTPTEGSIRDDKAVNMDFVKTCIMQDLYIREYGQKFISAEDPKGEKAIQEYLAKQPDEIILPL